MGPVLLTGGSGFVAGSVVTQCPPELELHVLSRAPVPLERPNIHPAKYSGFDEAEWRGIFHRVRPQAIIHLAAIAAIDYCETHHEEATQVNAYFPRILARLAQEHGARFVHASTDNVFDGRKGLYTELDPPAPVNFYGQTKVAAEEAVAGTTENHVIARISLVYGLPLLGAGNSFLAQMLPKLERGETIGVPENEIRSAIDVATLGAALLELAANNSRGILHLSGNDVLNRVQLVRRIAAHLGLDPAGVQPNDPTRLAGRAPRPLDVSLSNARASSVLKTPFLGTEAGMDAVISLKNRQPEEH